MGWSPVTWHNFTWEPAGGAGAVAWSGTAVVTWAYFTLDHLGSVAVITDGGGHVLQRLSYDAWGKERNPNGTAASCGAITVSATTRGFTNQEHLPTDCLVNLNARLYDTSIAKFMSPDSVTPDPYDGQSYNRYAYVTNNPLSFTDTTGNDPDDWSNFQCAINSCGGSSFTMGGTTQNTDSYVVLQSNGLGEITSSAVLTGAELNQSGQVTAVTDGAALSLAQSNVTPGSDNQANANAGGVPSIRYKT
jgi:RHS repeat-associated protein